MELATEVRAQELPPASIDTLKKLRNENCSSSTKDFRLQSFQLFLRRILSPDSPTRNMLLYHGAGVGKSCTAIQIAEEYILRPEFQNKKVIVIASAAVQENFRTQIFDVTRVKQDPSGMLFSQQCTGRKYLDMLERAQTEGLRWENPDNREKLNTIVQTMIDDFYEFRPYQGWGNIHERQRLTLSRADYATWIHSQYDERLIIIDEAHNIRDDEEGNKAVSEALTDIVKTARGVTLVLLTATAMFDKFSEILHFFNIFLWNDHRQPTTKEIKVSEIFEKDGTFKSPEAEALVRGWCHEYISFLRGENPFTFPFRLPPPDELVGKFDRTLDIQNRRITKPRKYLPLTVSYLQSPQKEAVQAIEGTLRDTVAPTIVTSPDGRPLSKCFERGSDIKKFLFKYAKDVPPFLSPSNLPKYATKFATIMNCITDTSGIVFVYSNIIRGGVLQFAMALEEAGFEPAAGARVLESTSGEYTGVSRGKYAFLTSDTGDKQIEQFIRRLRRPENSTGEDIRVILASPLASEGIDFKYIRQVHILDPWYNMSRIEQIIGRGLRTCSHSGLPFEQQNCTVYLHTTRYSDSTQETYDEYMYRVYVEEKASVIAKIKRVISESAIDCSSQISTNMLPEAWRELRITQVRSQDGVAITLPLSAMSAPTFEDGTPALVCSRFDTAPASEYVRPLGAYFDIRDEVFDTLIRMFRNKPIWSLDDLTASKQLQYAPDVVKYLLQDAVGSHLKMKDSKGRVGFLENREGMFAFTPAGALENATLTERLTNTQSINRIPIPTEDVAPVVPVAPGPVVPGPAVPGPAVPGPAAPAPARLPTGIAVNDIESKYTFPFDASKFSKEVRQWYILDHIFTREEKIDFLKTNRSPPWGKGLVVEGVELLALGPDTIFNSSGELTEPIGREKDAVQLWTNTHIDAIVEEIKTNNKILCTVEDRVLKFAAFEVIDGHVVRIKRSKTIAPKACPFFGKIELSTFVKDCTGADFPAAVKTKETQCIYLSLAVRTAWLAKSPYVVWVLPEIWAFVSANSAKVRAKLA